MASPRATARSRRPPIPTFVVGSAGAQHRGQRHGAGYRTDGGGGHLRLAASRHDLPELRQAGAVIELHRWPDRHAAADGYAARLPGFPCM
jgi:hypothetical protein